MEPQLPAVNFRGTVLIADDNPETRRLLEARARREGYQVVLAESGQQALDLLKQRDVDVILLDVFMPDKDGFEVLAAVQADPERAHIPVLMISGVGDEQDITRCIEMGAVDYLVKPLNQAMIRARLAACVSMKKKRERERQSIALAHNTAVGLPSSTTPTEGQGLPPYDLPPGEAGNKPFPRRVGRIVLERVLGTGSMGYVLLGHHELLDLPVAVKLLLPELLANAEMRARILREARVAARISHPNVVRLHEVGETEHGIHLAYEYVDGGTLEAWLRRRPNRRVDIRTAVRIARKIASGLTEIHRLGLTHRDIKPGNLLLTRDGRIKIADLGLAKQFDGGPAHNLTRDHVVLGTPVYMAPEQAQGRKDLDIRCDLYALGVTLYEMLTGRLPFERKTSLAFVLSHLVSPVPPPTVYRPDIPPWLEQVCLKLLAKDRDERYATPEALLADLQAQTV
jgi:CheY-like chemotaxis protein